MGESEVLIDGAEGGNRVGFEVGEAEFVKTFGWDEGALGVERVVERAVAAEDFGVELGAVGFLQIGVPNGGVPIVLARAEDVVGVAVNVNKAGIRKPF